MEKIKFSRSLQSSLPYPFNLGFAFFYSHEKTGQATGNGNIIYSILPAVESKWRLFDNVQSAEAILKQMAFQQLKENYAAGLHATETKYTYGKYGFPEKCPYSAEDVPAEFIIE